MQSCLYHTNIQTSKHANKPTNWIYRCVDIRTNTHTKQFQGLENNILYCLILTKMWQELLSNLAGKQRTKKEASQNTNRHNPGGHERKILQKLRNAERNNLTRPQRLAKQKLTNWLIWGCDSFVMCAHIFQGNMLNMSSKVIDYKENITMYLIFKWNDSRVRAYTNF